jgi:6-phosphogluconolactonase
MIEADEASTATALAVRLTNLIITSTHRPFTVALAGGSTPRRLYELLARPPFVGRIPWDNVELFFGDERAVPPDHPDSNFGMVSRALLAKTTVAAHRMRAEEGAAEAYEGLLAERIAARRRGMPVLDVILLGIGEDGHTASLFPATRALAEHTHAVVMNEVPQLQTRRMTMTYPLINAAEHVWLLVTGERKRHIVARCLGDEAAPPDAPPWPVLGIQPDPGELVWWLDDAAAAGAPHLATGR